MRDDHAVGPINITNSSIEQVRACVERIIYVFGEAEDVELRDLQAIKELMTLSIARSVTCSAFFVSECIDNGIIN